MSEAKQQTSIIEDALLRSKYLQIN